jgi:hypothetical protein
MSDIFVSYRREDTQGWVGRLTRAVQEGFPPAQVFYDIATIRPGKDFPTAIEQALSSCQIMLVLIGPRWLSAQTTEGQRRIDEPDDFVRIEIATALARSILVVPVLFGGARMPTAAILPDVLRPLARRQGHELSDTRWDYDCDLLLQVVGESMGVPPQRNSLKEGSALRGDISVARGATIANARVGDIVGVKVSGFGTVISPDSIDVAENAHIRDSEIGDVAGVKIQDQEK